MLNCSGSRVQQVRRACIRGARSNYATHDHLGTLPSASSLVSPRPKNSDAASRLIRTGKPGSSRESTSGKHGNRNEVSGMHYIRAAKTGSGTALAYFHATNCARHMQIHESHMVFAQHVPCPQKSFTVMREPCERAASQIAHMFNYANGRSSFAYRFKNHTLTLTNATSLRDFAEFVNASHAHRARMLGTHVDIFFAQSRYVGPCTEVLCLESGQRDSASDFPPMHMVRSPEAIPRQMVGLRAAPHVLRAWSLSGTSAAPCMQAAHMCTSCCPVRKPGSSPRCSACARAHSRSHPASTSADAPAPAPTRPRVKGVLPCGPCTVTTGTSIASIARTVVREGEGGSGPRFN